LTKPQRFTVRFFALLLLLLHQTALAIADVLLMRDWRDVQVLIPRVSTFPPTSLSRTVIDIPIPEEW